MSIPKFQPCFYEKIDTYLDSFEKFQLAKMEDSEAAKAKAKARAWKSLKQICDKDTSIRRKIFGKVMSDKDYRAAIKTDEITQNIFDPAIVERIRNLKQKAFPSNTINPSKAVRLFKESRMISVPDNQSKSPNSVVYTPKQALPSSPIKHNTNNSNYFSSLDETFPLPQLPMRSRIHSVEENEKITNSPISTQLSFDPPPSQSKIDTAYKVNQSVYTYALIPAPMPAVKKVNEDLIDQVKVNSSSIYSDALIDPNALTSIRNGNQTLFSQSEGRSRTSTSDSEESILSQFSQTDDRNLRVPPYQRTWKEWGWQMLTGIVESIGSFFTYLWNSLPSFR